MPVDDCCWIGGGHYSRCGLGEIAICHATGHIEELPLPSSYPLHEVASSDDDHLQAGGQEADVAPTQVVIPPTPAVGPQVAPGAAIVQDRATAAAG